jgi:hypothetical protein
MVTIMTALYFHFLHEGDRACEVGNRLR